MAASSSESGAVPRPSKEDLWTVNIGEESTDLFSSIFIPPSADGTPNESTPLRNSMGASAYTFGKGSELATLTLQHWWKRRLTWLLTFNFIGFVIFICPMIIAYHDSWTYSAAFYYSIQAMLGIGYGDLNVKSDELKWMMIFELIGGSFVVVFLASFLLANYLSRAEEEAEKALEESKTKIRLTTMGIYSVPTSLVSLAKGVVMLVLIIVVGTLYGMFYEGWNLVTALFFIISTCQTSGLVEPGVAANSEAWPAVFLAGLCIAAVPTWAYVVGKAATILAEREQSARRLLSAVDRQRRAEEAYMRKLHSQKGDSPSSSVDRAGFLELWLLRNDLVSEDALATIRAEFEGLQSSAGSFPQKPGEAHVDLRIVSLRLRFLQLVALGLVEPDSWEQALATALAHKGADTPERS